MTNQTIQALYEKAPIKPYTTNKAIPLFNPSPQLLYGVELEIENCREEMAVGGMTQTTDGSLRNNGLEFITKPMTYSNLYCVLEQFFNKNKLTDANYSERCSVHVHSNVLDLTLPQLAAITLVYQVFEGVLFNWIGNDRNKNIFCVPWSDTTLSYRTVQRLADSDTFPVHEWQKYTALNLRPVQEQGSIEWRHMEGTCDLQRIMTWCRLIGYIYRFATAADFQTVQNVFMNLNTTSQYLGALQQVFGDDHQVLRCPGYEELLEDGVLTMKYSLINPNKSKKKATADGTYIINPLPGARIVMDEWAPQVNWAAIRADMDAQLAQVRRPTVPRREPVNPATVLFDDVLNVEERNNF